MAEDQGVKAEIDKLKAKWDTNKKNSAPGSVALWIPVDNDQVTLFRCPGIVVRTLGFTKDELADFDKAHVYKPAEPPSSTNTTNRRLKKTKSISSRKKILKEVQIHLKEGIAYQVKNANRIRKTLTMRVPDIVCIDCINYFLWYMSTAEQRPISFCTSTSEIQLLSKLEKADLGVLSTKVTDDSTPKPNRGE